MMSLFFFSGLFGDYLSPLNFGYITDDLVDGKGALYRYGALSLNTLSACSHKNTLLFNSHPFT